MISPRPPRPVIRHVGGTVTAPGAVLTPFTLLPGDGSGSQIVIPSTGDPTKVFLCASWDRNNAAGLTQIHGQNMANDEEGFQYGVVPSPDVNLGWPTPSLGQVFVNDRINVDKSGSAVGGEIETVALLFYEFNGEVGGQKLLTYEEYLLRKKFEMTIPFSLTASGAAEYSGQTALSAATTNRMRGNVDYAILGAAILEAEVCSIVIQGPSTQNVRIGIPGESLNKDRNRNFFIDMARAYGLPFIPVVNEADRDNTIVSLFEDQRGGTYTVHLICAELRP